MAWGQFWFKTKAKGNIPLWSYGKGQCCKLRARQESKSEAAVGGIVGNGRDCSKIGYIPSSIT
jgi:hypothetical protein